MPDRNLPQQVALITGADLRTGAPGGTRSYVLGLSAFLAEQGIDVSLVVNGPVAEVHDKCRIIKVTEKHAPSSSTFQRELRHWIGRNSPLEVELLHFQRPDDIIAFREGRPYPPSICTLHGNARKGVRYRRGRLIGFAYAVREARSLSRFQAVIAVDRATADAYCARYPRISSRFRLIPIAVHEPEKTDQRGHPAHSETQQAVTFLFVGRLSAEKRVDRIIEAFRELGLAHSALIIAGSGPAEKRLRHLVDDLCVRFLGPLGQRDLWAWYRHADALILASEFEGLPTAALESLAHGCPVVAPKGSGLDAVLNDRRGVLYRGISDLPDAMMAAVRLKASGQEIDVPKDYTWGSVGPRILSLYATVIGGAET